MFYWQTTKKENDQYYKKIFNLQPNAYRIEMSNGLLDQFIRAAQHNTSNDIETGVLKIHLSYEFLIVLCRRQSVGNDREWSSKGAMCAYHAATRSIR